MAAAWVNSSWVTDPLEHRLMMRLSEALLPAFFMFSASPLTLVTLLTYPELIITDHGHFQFNKISLVPCPIMMSDGCLLSIGICQETRNIGFSEN